MRRTLKNGVIALIGLPFLLFLVTQFQYVPVSLTVGWCSYDWTSPSTYSSRLSPLKEQAFELDGDAALVCYGSPSARQRKVFGGMVRPNRLWRFGANEPTRFYTTTDVNFGGLPLKAGRYSLYALPGESEWEIFVNESVWHWGNMITRDVRQQEVGSITVPIDSTADFVESFTIEVSEHSPGKNLMSVMWEHTRVDIPISTR